MSTKKKAGTGCAIVGVGTAGCGEAQGFSDVEILALAAHNAVLDSGLQFKDIDGIATANVNSPMWALNVVEYLNIKPKFVESTNIGGSSFIAHLQPILHALASGQCNAVLVCYGSTQRTQTIGRREKLKAKQLIDPYPYESPYQPLVPITPYALMAARHMHQFGTTRRHLAEVAVAARRWAQLNPEAFRRDPLDIDEVLAAKMIADPFTVHDCCLVTDGAGAFVITRNDLAKDLSKAPVHVLSNATAVWHRQVSSMADFTITPAVESGSRAFQEAGLKPSDVDVVQLYDAFSINPILFLEDLGFCKKGEGGPFVENGGIAPGGHLAVNTNGGGLSCVHPNMYGTFEVIEAVRQLRDEAGARQVKDAKIALIHGNGGVSGASQSTALLGVSEVL
ncbi:thiolase [Ottowia thiooxydans]|uniref:thiolase n=1 Tax=Ottowia thiooxydans TaxID=219182 RepID=UPI00040364A2|nr:thiolase [Ottowia thiooxydans]